jgi:hypothetical protein
MTGWSHGVLQTWSQCGCGEAASRPGPHVGAHAGAGPRGGKPRWAVGEELGPDSVFLFLAFFFIFSVFFSHFEFQIQHLNLNSTL